MSANSLYESLGFLKEGGSFESRRKWKQAEGRIETVSPPERSAEMVQQALKAQLSKEAALSDRFNFGGFEVLALPGDRLEFSRPLDKAVAGKYLVKECHIAIGTAAPRCDMVLTRA
ncbi:hypothetical protein K2X33_02160, partial [bacterium]|nr:hypothetical protein [bacterium]